LKEVSGYEVLKVPFPLGEGVLGRPFPHPREDFEWNFTTEMFTLTQTGTYNND
jgi:hypothetical protein